MSTTSASCDLIKFEMVDMIGHIVLNDPPENRMTMQFFKRLHEIVNNIKELDYIRGLIIRSNGRHFSSGADLNDLIQAVKSSIMIDGQKGVNDYSSVLYQNVETFNSIASLKIPVVAAIQGVCIGSALELALCAQVRVCEQRTSLGLPEVLFNLMPGCGGTVRLPHLTGVSTAMELVMSGEIISAEDAFVKGITDAIVPRKQSTEIAIHLIKMFENSGSGGSFRDMVLKCVTSGDLSRIDP